MIPDKRIKRSILSIIILIFLLFCSDRGFGQSPPLIEWKEIRTEHFEIIFPAGLEADAQRVANLTEHFARCHNLTMKSEYSSVPIVLINQSTDSNGYVNYAPLMSHWYSTPSSFPATEWYKALASHEGRHIVQNRKLGSGFGKRLWSLCLGDIGTATFDFLYIPVWFSEGDAVLAETIFTNGGRGRLPFFDLWLRAQELSGKRLSYEENYLGSYDDPYIFSDPYKLGYLMTTHACREYGADVWERVLGETGKYVIYPTFDKSLSDITGRSIRQLYRDTMDEVMLMWEEQQSDLAFTPVKRISPPCREPWTYYLCPQYTDNGILSIKTDPDNNCAVVRFSPSGEEKFIRELPYNSSYRPLMSNERSISAGGGKLSWLTVTPDIRWRYRNYSDIAIMDTAAGEAEELTRNGKFTSCALSKDGNRIAGVEFTPERECFLKIIDTQKGETEVSYKVPANEFIFDPAWSAAGTKIAFADLTDRGSSLKIFDLEKRIIKTIIPPTAGEHIKSPCFYGSYILYESDYSGINNIYAVEIKSGERFQVTSRPYGAFFPEVSGNLEEVYFSNYTPKGYEIVSSPLDPSKWKSLDEVKIRRSSYFKPISKSVTGGKKKKAEERKYKVSKYSPLLHTFNFHSLIPSIDTTNEDIFFNLLSNDVLLTTQTLLGCRYNYRKNAGSIGLSMDYAGRFPVFSIGGKYGKRADPLEHSDDFRTWKETEGRIGVYFPLNLSRGTYYRHLRFGSFAEHREISDRSLYDYSENYDYSVKSLYHYILFSRSKQKSPHDIYPSFAQNLIVSLNHTVGSSYRGNKLNLRSTIFLPGLFDHDSFHFEGALEQQKLSNTYRWSNSVLFPRGYIESDERILDNFYRFSANYTFPLMNTNISIWKVLYIKRINGSFFFDYGLTENNEKRLLYRSVGIELPLESFLLSNKHMRIRTGLRCSYCIDNDKTQFDLILSIN